MSTYLYYSSIWQRETWLKPIIHYFYSKLQQIVIKRSNIFLKRYRSRCSRRFCFYTFDIPHRYKDLYYGIQSTFKIFTNDTFLFLSQILTRYQKIPWIQTCILYHCVKSVQIRSFFWSGKVRTRRNSLFGHFSRSICYQVHQRKMLFSSDPKKQATEVYFPRKHNLLLTNH